MNNAAPILLLLAATLAQAQTDSPGRDEAADLFHLLQASMSERVLLMEADDSGYAMLAVPDAVRRHPDAPLRLVVMRGGEPVADWGLRERREVEPESTGGGSRAVRERGLVENAYIAGDGRSAALVRTTYDLRRDPVEGARMIDSGSSLTWIDPDHPEGRWTVEFDGGRTIRLAYPFSGGRGVVVMTSQDGAAGGALSVYGPDRDRFVYFGLLEATPRELRPTAHDAFLGIELAFPPRPGAPDQGILVVDVLRRTHWTYAWSYGTDREPASWRLEDSGMLVISSLGRERRYDRFGRLLSEGGPKRR